MGMYNSRPSRNRRRKTALINLEKSMKAERNKEGENKEEESKIQRRVQRMENEYSILKERIY